MRLDKEKQQVRLVWEQITHNCQERLSPAHGPSTSLAPWILPHQGKEPTQPGLLRPCVGCISLFQAHCGLLCSTPVGVWITRRLSVFQTPRGGTGSFCCSPREMRAGRLSCLGWGGELLAVGEQHTLFTGADLPLSLLHTSKSVGPSSTRAHCVFLGDSDTSDEFRCPPGAGTLPWQCQPMHGVIPPYSSLSI